MCKLVLALFLNAFKTILKPYSYNEHYCFFRCVKQLLVNKSARSPLDGVDEEMVHLITLKCLMFALAYHCQLLHQTQKVCRPRNTRNFDHISYWYS